MPRRATAEPPAETEASSSSRLEIWLFAALFAIGALVLGFASIFGGEIRF
jgi:hypothetical protein